uniref:Uncharacterized protein n=1 Tax=Tanacetum cinerariifolium TaxID=118510 RepID=A0A6L2KQX3_TANCI|nr:hypothetical protein [Tanacetum cinerariifolium]
MSSSTVTYMSVYFDFEPWRFQWVSDDEPEAPEEAPQPLDHAPLSPDYVHVLSTHHHYVPGPNYPEYVTSSDDEVPIEDQPLPADALPNALSPAYGDEEKHLASADSTTLPVVKPVPSAEDTEAFETNESAPTPPTSPQTRVPFSQMRLRRAQKIVRLSPPMAASTEALIAEYAVAPTPPLPPPSPLTPLLSPLLHIPSPPLPLPSPPTHTSPTHVEAPLGYKAAMIQ